jgi:two-component sensor histidine kinase
MPRTKKEPAQAPSGWGWSHPSAKPTDAVGLRNTLQLVSSLLGLQAAQADATTAEALRSAQARVRTFALVHEAQDAGRLDLRDWLARIAQGFAGPDGRARILTSLDEVNVPEKVRIPLAMIVHELVTNAVLHAFPPPRTGRVVVSLARMEPPQEGIELRVLDDGVGHASAPRPGLGLQLVALWVEQLGGSLHVERGEHGTDVRVRVPERGE